MSIAVAVSGGMDSLLALALVRQSGREVLALHAHFLPPDDAGERLARALDAQCRTLGVPFAAVDLSREFEDRVVAPFARAYARGLTPNPCAGCNRDMKFGLLLARARDLGATAIATGHYARLEHGALLRGADPAQDQSYFLSLTPAQALARVEFPLGGWRKADVPAALAQRGLAPPLARESQEVCFIPGDDYRAFLLARGAGLPEAGLPGPGPVALADGRVIGRHDGLWRHTVGQRKGLGIPWSEPLYVLEKRAGDNTLVVGPKAQATTLGFQARDANVLVDPADWPGEVLVRSCYRQRPRPALVTLQGDTLGVDYPEPAPRTAPGQVAAVYDGEGRVLAAGVIA